MANSRPSDWSNQHPGNGFGVFQGTGRAHIGHEPPYGINGYEHEGYEEKHDPRESDELAHDDGYLPGWGAESAGSGYPGAEPGYSGPVYVPPSDPWAGPPTDPWDAPDNGYAFRSVGRWEEYPAAATRGPRARQEPRTRHGGRGGRGAGRSPRAVWMAAIGATALMMAVLVFRWVGDAPAASAPPANTMRTGAAQTGAARDGAAAAAARTGGMPARGAASPSYRLVAARQADGFTYNATASNRMATAPNAAAGNDTGLAHCLEARGLSTGGTVTGVRYAQYNDDKDVTGLSLIGFGGTFGSGAARDLWQAAGSCGALASGAAATTAAPGPDGGTLYTSTGYPNGTTCVWSTGTTAAIVWFFNGMAGLTVRDPAAACQAVRSAVEARALYRTYVCCARA